MATSKFEKRFTNNTGSPLLGATVEIVPQANTYPTGKILLIEHPTRRGWYYKDAVALGEYKIYINGTLYTQNIFHGENILTYIAALFDENLAYHSLIRSNELLKNSGVGTFTGTNTTCIITVTNANIADLYFVTPIGSTWNANDQLIVTPDYGSFKVTRNAGGTSGLRFYWFRILASIQGVPIGPEI